MLLNEVLKQHGSRIRRLCWPHTTFVVPTPEGFIGPQGQLVYLTPEDVTAPDWHIQASSVPDQYYLIFSRASKVIVGGALTLPEANKYKEKEPVDIYIFKKGDLCP